MTRLLIVEDEKLLRDGIASITDWSAAGFDLCTMAANGKEAVSIIEQEHPDMVLTDIRMPEMDGVELTARIKRRWPWIVVLVLSGFDDFDFVRSSLTLGAHDYLLKSRIDMKSLVSLLDRARAPVSHWNDETLDSVRARSLFLSGRGPAPADAEWLSESIRLVLVAALDGERSQRAAERLSEVWGLGASAVAPVLGTRTVAIVVPDEHARRVVFPVGAIPRGAAAVISDPIERAENAHEVLLRLPNPIDLAFYLPDRSCFSEGEAVLVDACPELDYSGVLDACRKMLIDDVFDRYSAMLEQRVFIFLGAASEKPTPRALKIRLTESVFFLMHSLESFGLYRGTWANMKFQAMSGIEEASDFGDLRNKIDEIVEKLRSHALESRPHHISPPVQRAIDYIDENFRRPMGLSEVAKETNVNKNYLCEVFKRQTGVNFVDYVNRRRVDEAKKLIREGQLNVNEICDSLGFENVSYFSQLFKRYIGLSPSEYRKKAAVI